MQRQANERARAETSNDRDSPEPRELEFGCAFGCCPVGSAPHQWLANDLHRASALTLLSHRMRRERELEAEALAVSEALAAEGRLRALRAGNERDTSSCDARIGALEAEMPNRRGAVHAPRAARGPQTDTVKLELVLFADFLKACGVLDESLIAESLHGRNVNAADKLRQDRKRLRSLISYDFSPQALAHHAARHWNAIVDDELARVDIAPSIRTRVVERVRKRMNSIERGLRAREQFRKTSHVPFS